MAEESTENANIVIEMLKHEIEYLNVTVRLVKSELEKERNHRKILQLQLKSGTSSDDQSSDDFDEHSKHKDQILLNRDIYSILDLTELLKYFQENLLSLATIDGVLFNLLDPEKENLVCELIKLPPAYYGVEAMYKHYKFPLSQFDANVHAFRDQAPVTVDEFSLDNYSESTKTRFERWKMSQMIVIPVLSSEDVNPIGTLMIFSQEEEVDKTSVAIIQKLLQDFLVPLKNAVKYTNLKRRENAILNIEEEHLRFLRFVVEINNLNNVELIREIVCDEFLASFDFDVASMFIQDDNQLKCCKTVVSDDEYNGIQENWTKYFHNKHYELSLKDGSPPTCYLQNAIQHIPDIVDIVHLPMSEIDRDIVNIMGGEPHTMLCLPIREHYHPVGVLWMFSLKKQIKLTDQQLKLIELLCVFVGAEMANAQLYTTVEKQKIEIEALNLDLNSMVHELEEHKNNLQYLVTEKTYDITLAKNEAERANAAKSEFLANMSHELRTPLNSMLMLTKLILNDDEKNLTPNQLEYAKIIYESGQNLLQLINDILDISKAESGKMQIDVVKLHLFDHINSIVDMYKISVEKQHLYLKFNLDKNVPTFIFSDPQRLEQVIVNLLSNAMKFTNEGGILIDVKCPQIENFKKVLPTKNSSNFIEICVIDTGIGISEEKQKNIFEAFIQADGSISRHYGGTGLGLAISKEICTLLGGDITLESKENSGSKFTLYLPIEPANNEMEEGDEGEEIESLISVESTDEECTTYEESEESVIEETKELDEPVVAKEGKAITSEEHIHDLPILILDNDMRNAYVLANKLRQKGMQVELADNVDLAISKINEIEHIHIAMIKGIKNIKKITENVPKDTLIMGAESNNNLDEVGSSGANICLSYPIDPDTLISQLHQMD